MMKERLATVVTRGVRVKQETVDHAARILVIEDNSSDVFLLKRALKKHDTPCEVLHLLNGADAMAFVRRQGPYAQMEVPSLILLDLSLSKYTGEDILREIRNTPYLKGIPVCVWSSSRSRQDAAIIEQLGVSRFIPKPTGLAQFMEIGKILKDLLAVPRAA